MYLYQDCVRLGQKLRNEKEKQQVFKNISLVELKDVQVREERQGEQDEFHMINVLKFGERQHQTCDTTPQSPSFECKCENVTLPFWPALSRRRLADWPSPTPAPRPSAPPVPGQGGPLSA